MSGRGLPEVYLPPPGKQRKRGTQGIIRQRSKPKQPVEERKKGTSGRDEAREARRKDREKRQEALGQAEGSRRIQRARKEEKILMRIRNNLNAFLGNRPVGSFSSTDLAFLLDIARDRRTAIQTEGLPFTPNPEETFGGVKLQEKRKLNKRVEVINQINQLANQVKTLIGQAQTKLRQDLNQPGRLQLLDNKGPDFRNFASAVIASNIKIRTAPLVLKDPRGKEGKLDVGAFAKEELEQFGFSEEAVSAIQEKGKGFEGGGQSKEVVVYNTIKDFIDRQAELGGQVAGIRPRVEPKFFSQTKQGSEVYNFTTPQNLYRASLARPQAVDDEVGRFLEPGGSFMMADAISNQISRTFGIPELSLVGGAGQNIRQPDPARVNPGTMRERGGDTAIDVVNIGGQGVPLGHTYHKNALVEQKIRQNQVPFVGGTITRDLIDPMFGSKTIQDLEPVYDANPYFASPLVAPGLPPPNLSRAEITSEGAVLNDIKSVLGPDKKRAFPIEEGSMRSVSQVSASGAITFTQIRGRTEQQVLAGGTAQSEFAPRKITFTTQPERDAGLAEESIERQLGEGTQRLKAPQRKINVIQPLGNTSTASIPELAYQEFQFN
tara:strand:+ start:4806 stop:6620 length:1815 start_codon:yes stop_codon:yes gene_type:complete